MMVFFVPQVDPSIRSMMALQEERGSTSYSELQNEVTKRSLMQPQDSKPPVFRWSRLPGQVGGIWKFYVIQQMANIFSENSDDLHQHRIGTEW